MFSLISALITHTWRILTLRHDGTGLPKKRNGLYYGVLTAMALAWVGMVWVSEAHHSEGGNNLAVAILSAILSVASLMVLFRPAPATALALAVTGTHTIALGVLWLSQTYYYAIDLVAALWPLVCLMSMVATRAKAIAAEKTKKRN